jgi:hypothetical protein
MSSLLLYLIPLSFALSLGKRKKSYGASYQGSTEDVVPQECFESGILVLYHSITWCHDPEDLDLNLYCHGNLKSCTGMLSFARYSTTDRTV